MVTGGKEVLHVLVWRGLGDLVRQIAASYHVTAEQIAGRQRTDLVAAARKHLWAELRSRGFSYSELGEMFGRDHTTILQGIRSHRKSRAQTRSFPVHEAASVLERLAYAHSRRG